MKIEEIIIKTVIIALVEKGELKPYWLSNYEKVEGITNKVIATRIEYQKLLSRARKINSLGLLISGNASPEDALDVLIEAQDNGHGEDWADEHINIFSPLEDTFTVDELLELISQ